MIQIAPAKPKKQDPVLGDFIAVGANRKNGNRFQPLALADVAFWQGIEASTVSAKTAVPSASPKGKFQISYGTSPLSYGTSPFDYGTCPPPLECLCPYVL